MKDTDNTLTLIEFAELIESMGLLALGEPFVRTTFVKGDEKLDLYLTYPQHGVHCVLASTSLIVNPSQLRLNMFSASEEKDEQPQDLLLSDFINANPGRRVKSLQLKEIQRAAMFVGSESSKKRLTWLLAQQILKTDVDTTDSTFHEKEQRLSTIIRSTTNAIGRPEQVAYLSRFNNLSQDDIEQFINFPIEWLSRSFLPSDSHKVITLPYLENKPVYPLHRSPLFLN